MRQQEAWRARNGRKYVGGHAQSGLKAFEASQGDQSGNAAAHNQTQHHGPALKVAGLGNSGHYFDAAFPVYLQCPADIGAARSGADVILEFPNAVHPLGIAANAAA